MSSPRITARFGASVRSLRHSLGLSQEALAELADLHRTYIAGIEGGVRNVTLKTIEKLALALQVPSATLLLDAGRQTERSDLINLPAFIGQYRPMEILLVTEQQAEVKLALRPLQQAPIINPVKVAHDGQEALDLLFHTRCSCDRQSGIRPQLVLLDLPLSKVSGFEVLHRLKADKRTRAIPVVVLTDSKSPKDTAECQRLGAEACIVKPASSESIVAALQKLQLAWLLLDQPPTAA